MLKSKEILIHILKYQMDQLGIPLISVFSLTRIYFNSD